MSIFTKKSVVGELSTYDIFASLRTGAIYIIGILAVNIPLVSQFLTENGVPATLVSLVTIIIIDLARRYVKDYTVSQ